MASNVFPMLSSSPPPIDDCPDDDDDDDEFGNFTSSNIPFDSSFDSPVSTEKFKAFKSGDNGVNDGNFSEIHKFSSFTNSTTPSPKEFVPNFSDETEHCKNGLKQIKNEKCKTSENDIDVSSSEDIVSNSKIEVTSHKSVPLKLECSSSELKSLPSEDCDSHQNLAHKSSVENNLEKEVLEDDENKFNSFDQVSLVCDLSKSKVTEELSVNLCDENKIYTSHETNTFISEAITDIEFPKTNTNVDRFSFNDESSLSVDEFPCNFESSENELEVFDDFQQSEKFPLSNEVLSSSLKSSNDNFTVYSNQDNLEVTFKCDFGSEEIKDFSDNEFDNFQACGDATFTEAAASVAKSSDDFEYDDFQDFQCSNVPNEETGDFDDFQDFSVANASCTDDFADFSAVPFDSNKVSQPSDTDEFADFEEAPFSAPSGDPSVQSSSASQKNVDTLSTVINAIFPFEECPQDTDASNETSPQILEQTNKSHRLWEKLHEVEQTPGLRFQWGVSHSFQQLLRSVNVDYHSILRTSSVPIFASGLSLLEPVKGLSSSVNHESEDRNHIPKDPIPPVEFDWNSSGLVNPLDSGHASSVLMDLSFLSSVETETNSSNNDHSFENELLKPSPCLNCPENSSKTQILEQLLSKNISSLPNSKITHRPSDLSDEAVRVLDQLPDLSFMQAKVLMFPISSKT